MALWPLRGADPPLWDPVSEFYSWLCLLVLCRTLRPNRAAVTASTSCRATRLTAPSAPGSFTRKVRGEWTPRMPQENDFLWTRGHYQADRDPFLDPAGVLSGPGRTADVLLRITSVSFFSPRSLSSIYCTGLAAPITCAPCDAAQPIKSAHSDKHCWSSLRVKGREETTSRGSHISFALWNIL